LEERNDRGGSVVFTSGQTVTYGELADVIEKVVGPETRVSREEWIVEYLEAELEKDPENLLKKYHVLFAAPKGVSWDEEKTINAQRGIETIGVEQWLREKLRI
jgi:nucleoside-diphosphate-sugar epimerase